MRNLTDEDVQAIAKAVQKEHCIAFSESDRQDIKTLLEIYRDTRSAVIKSIIGLVVIGMLVLLGIGASLKFKLGG